MFVFTGFYVLVVIFIVCGFFVLSYFRGKSIFKSIEDILIKYFED